ncbi:MAG TPA: hypothetical protein VF002_08260 [Gaiellaceae bacterium]
MRRVAFAGIAVAVALATAAAASSTRGPAVAVPHGVRAPAQRGPLLAVFQRRRGAVLGWLDKRALVLARGSPRLVLPHSLDAWAYSSDRNVLALGTVTLRGANNPIPWLQFVDPKSLRRLARTPLGSGYVAAIGWGSDRVNVLVERWCCPQSFDAASIDSSSHRLVSKQHLENAILQLQRVGGSIVLLTGPAAGIGTAGLTVVDPDGTLRSVVLSQIQAGRDVLSEDGSNLTKAQQNIPGLAVDPASGRAFVVSASGAVAEISLASLAVSYHSVSQPVSLLGRLHDLVEPRPRRRGSPGLGARRFGSATASSRSTGTTRRSRRIRTGPRCSSANPRASASSTRAAGARSRSTPGPTRSRSRATTCL